MPIILPPITRRQFLRHSIAIGGTSIIAPSQLASTVSEAVHLDQNRVAVLSDTHISVDPDSVYPGTKWPGSPVKDSEHEWVNMAN